jgi:hypothetical protein
MTDWLKQFWSKLEAGDIGALTLAILVSMAIGELITTLRGAGQDIIPFYAKPNFGLKR